MRKATQVALALVLGVVLAASAGYGADNFSGFLGNYYKNLTQGPEGGAKLRWIKPGADFGKYNKMMIDSVVFYYAPDSPDMGIDGQEMKELADSFNQELVNALKDKYPIVAEPAPDVVRIRIALTNVKKSKPVLSAVTSVVPAGIAISLVKKGVTGSWTGSGATSAELMALDSLTNEVVVVSVDDQTAGFGERFSRLGSATEAFKFWSQRVRVFMDDSRRTK